MDIFTHAAAITILLYASGNVALIPFGILGAVIIDIDMAYSVIARRNTSLFLFFHGGINHSIVGATILSAVMLGITFLLSSAGLILFLFNGQEILPAFAAILSGAYLHLFLDYLAAPGLSVFYPISEKKFGLSLFPMAFYFLFTAISLVMLGFVLLRGLTPALAVIYSAVFLGIIVLCLGLRWFVSSKFDGKTYSSFTFHPFRRVVIRENPSSWSVTVFEIFRGVIRKETFEKYRNIAQSEVKRYFNVPEIQRHRYYSYISIVEKNDSEITFFDPVRLGDFITYPTWYPSVTVLPDDSL